MRKRKSITHSDVPTSASGPSRAGSLRTDTGAPRGLPGIAALAFSRPDRFDALMNETGTVRWGVIGCGDVCEVKSAPGMRKCVGSELRIVMRRNSERARDYAERHGVPEWTANARRVVEHPEVDAIYIATPPGSHLEHALAVARAGKPCYVEKPIARHATEAERMVEAFRAAKQPLFVAYYRRRLPRFLKLRELINDGVLGEVTHLAYRFGKPAHRWTEREANWRLNAKDAGGGLFLDLGSHVLDLFDHLFGALEVTRGLAWNQLGIDAVEDHVSLCFRAASGVGGTVSFDFTSSRWVDELVVSGTDAEVHLSVFGSEPLRLVSDDRVQELECPHPAHVQKPLIQTIVDELRGVGAPCPSTGASALRTARVMDAVLNDYYGGRDDEFWTRAESWPGTKERRIQRNFPGLRDPSALT